jgi:hypothetical protein
MAQAERSRKVRSLLAEGVVLPEWAIGEQPLNFPPEVVAALRAGSQFRARVQYPERGNLMVFRAFLAAPTDPAPPLPALSDDDGRIVTHLVFEIRKVQIATFPELSLGLYGRVLSEVKPSPFFPGLTGRLVGVQLGVQQEGETPVSMLTVTVAGDHVVVAREGRGRLGLRP